jgi:OmpA-OmpF porin, OOP family
VINLQRSNEWSNQRSSSAFGTIMRARHRLLLGVVLLPAAAAAQSHSGLYVSIAGGVGVAGDMLSGDDTIRIRTSPGGLGLAGIGWGWDNGWRTELEGSYRFNPVAGLSIRRPDGEMVPLYGSSGTARVYATMANIAYDVPVPLSAFPIQPYLGAGAGYGWFRQDAGAYGTAIAPQANDQAAPVLLRPGSAGAFAYQAMAGATMPLRFLPGLAIAMEYRFFGTARFDLPVFRSSAAGTNIFNATTPPNLAHTGFSEQDNAVLIQLRYRFGAN